MKARKEKDEIEKREKEKIIQKFEKVLASRNYKLLEKQLATMNYEEEWTEKLVSRYEAFKIYGAHKSAKVVYYYNKRVSWSPLCAAVYAKDEEATKLVLARWPYIGLFRKTKAALLKAQQGLTDTIRISYTNPDPYYYYYVDYKITSRELDLTQLQEAETLLMYYVEKLPGFNFNYSKDDKLKMHAFFYAKINQTNTIDALIDFYNAHIEFKCISDHGKNWHKFSSFFTKNAAYPNSKIAFIELVQAHAIKLIEAADFSKLSSSKIFDEKHCLSGVSSKYSETFKYNVDRHNTNKVEASTILSIPSTPQASTKELDDLEQKEGYEILEKNTATYR